MSVIQKLLFYLIGAKKSIRKLRKWVKRLGIGGVLLVPRLYPGRQRRMTLGNILNLRTKKRLAMALGLGDGIECVMINLFAI